MRRLQGFTFIELLIVLAIMSLLLITIPNFYLQQSIITLRSAASEVRLALEEAQSKAQSNAVAKCTGADEFIKYTNFVGNRVTFSESGGEFSINIQGSCTNPTAYYTYSSAPITKKYRDITISTPAVVVSFTKRSGLPTSSSTICVHSSAGGMARPYIKIQVTTTGDIRQYDPSETCP